MIKKIFIIFFFTSLITFSFDRIPHESQAADTVTVAEELTKLNELYKEGIITKEEFSKAKALILDPNVVYQKKKKKKRTISTMGEYEGKTAAERKKIKELEEKKLKTAKRRELEEKRAEKERIIQERMEACEVDPKGKTCKKLTTKFSNMLEKIRERERKKKDKTMSEFAASDSQASLERKKKIKAKQAEKEKLRAEKKKACLDDPESKACKEGKPTEKIKNVLKKVKKKIGG